MKQHSAGSWQCALLQGWRKAAIQAERSLGEMVQEGAGGAGNGQRVHVRKYTYTKEVLGKGCRGPKSGPRSHPRYLSERGLSQAALSRLLVMCIAATAGDSTHPRRSLTSHYPRYIGTRQLGALPPADVIQNLGLSVFPTSRGNKQLDSGVGSLASIIPLLTSLPLGGDSREKGDAKSSRYLVAKGLPTLPIKLVDRIWNLEYVDMEEFLPAPQSLRLAEQGKPVPSLQESLVWAFNQFQAIRSQRTQRRVLDAITWMKCFTLYIAMMAKQRSDMVQCMVAHLHTVLKLHQKARRGWSMIFNFAWRWQLKKTLCGWRVTPGSMLPTSPAQAQTRTHLIWRRSQ